MINSVDYVSFARDFARQAKELAIDVAENERRYIATIVENFATLAYESLLKDEYSEEDCRFITQLVSEWTYHKSMDLIKSNVPVEHRDVVLQSIAFAIFEISKECLKQEVEQDVLLNNIEHYVNKIYKEKIEELYSKKLITKVIHDNALSRSNIDDMAQDIINQREHFKTNIEKNIQTKYLLKTTLSVIVCLILAAASFGLFYYFAPNKDTHSLRMAVKVIGGITVFVIAFLHGIFLNSRNEDLVDCKDNCDLFIDE